MYTTRDYGITYLLHDRCAVACCCTINCSRLVTLQCSRLWDVNSPQERIVWGRSPPRPLLAVPNVTAHPPTASVLIVFLYNGLLLCNFNVPVKGLITNFNATDHIISYAIRGSMVYMNDLTWTTRCVFCLISGSNKTYPTKITPLHPRKSPT